MPGVKTPFQSRTRGGGCRMVPCTPKPLTKDQHWDLYIASPVGTEAAREHFQNYLKAGLSVDLGDDDSEEE